MKEFGIDCKYNFLGPSKPALPQKEAMNLGLKPGEHVKVFQDDYTWTGTIMYDEKLPPMYQWYVRLD
ncbi:MAG: hypothetical protein GX270_01200 [Clostridiaceae bacterium]|nr:hypothetical protein [Clostridiaceae bacterium]